MGLNPSEKMKRFFATSKSTNFKKGEIVLRAGDQRSAAFYLKRGYAKDSSMSLDGREFTLFIFKPEDIFSYSWIFNKTHNGHSFRAMTDCAIIEKNREAFLLFLEENPDVQFMIAQNISMRMRGLTQRMEQMAFGSATQKVASIMSILGERFGKEVDNKIVISLRLTQQDIAELIGISRETTSIEINKLTVENVLSHALGHYIINNPKLLLKYSRLSS